MTDTVCGTGAPLLIERDGGVLRLTLNSPANLNAIGPAGEVALVEALRALRTDRETRVVILTGAGKAFSAGGDVTRNIHLQQAPVQVNEELQNAKQLITTLLEVEQPILARINGDAVGLGATLALFCDMTFMAATARIGDPHVRVGLAAGDGGALIWPQLIGYAKAKQYLLSGDLLAANEAAAIGLVNFAVPVEELDALVDKWAERFTRGAPLALRGTKAAINAGLKSIVDPVMDVGLLHEKLTFASEDVVEASRAFIEKRKPEFKGR
jgi:enoyl-CoA hydratase